MLDGVRSGPIITGAYTSPEGTCPMLAAHRRGGRTSLATFARAWDAYTGATGARLATERELRTLEGMLEASLEEESAPSAGELAQAIADHQEARRLAAGREHHERRSAATTRGNEGEAESRGGTGEARPAPGDPDRSHELRDRPGWAWTRVFRRLDDYEAALSRVREREAAEREESLAGV